MAQNAGNKLDGCLFYYRYPIIRLMENKNSNRALSLTLSHIPTLILVVGYAVFWVELYLLEGELGRTSLLASILSFLLCVYVFWCRRESILISFLDCRKKFQEQSIVSKAILSLAFLAAALILFCAFYASLLPPHLIQESDVLNYHYTLPRQHLITHSFKHIPWSSADLFPLPIQFALAPYWFATNLPNKFPQFIFLIGLLGVVYDLAKRFGVKERWNVWLIIFAVIGSHNIGIQMGTAMLDLIICYLFLAFMDSFLKGNMVLAAIEFSFFFWSKSFIPFQMILITLTMFLLFKIFRIFDFKNVTWGFNQNIAPLETGKLKRFLLGIIVFSVLIGGPFLAKSLYYSGTPFYPFGSGLVKIRANSDTTTWQSLQKAAKAHISYKDSYGYGRSFKDFVRHFWLIAVPDKGVNNKFDYPVGLPYLLFVGPFSYFLYRSMKRRIFPIVPFFVVIYWILWWVGAQQTRFLYIPIILMYITVIAEFRSPSFFLRGAVFFALLLNALSVFRAYHNDFGVKPLNVLREKDLILVAQSERYMSKNEKGYIDLPFGDVAFAQFPVDVTQEKLPFIISH